MIITGGYSTDSQLLIYDIANHKFIYQKEYFEIKPFNHANWIVQI